MLCDDEDRNMSAYRSIGLGLLLTAVLSMPAAAQTEAIAWQTNLETAKAEAKRSGRLVLVHFWTEESAPCMALERNVFNQPQVAGALAQQFVPVKLNANDHSTIATGMGVTRVPMDIVITPEGQIVGKLVSPPTPMAYIAELTQLANKNHSQSGQPFAVASAAAPQPTQFNSAYATLPVSPSTPAAAALAHASANPYQPMSPSAAPAMTDNRYFQSPTNGVQSSTAGQPVANQFVTAPTAAQGTGPAITNPPPSQVTAQTVSNQHVAQPPLAAAPIPTGTTTPNATPATSIAQAAPDPRQLPAGSPPLGFDGYCAVTMRNEWRWVAGNSQFGIVHRGRTYWFAGAKEQQQFWANPDFYAPALSGVDPVMAIEHRQQVPGRREHSIDYDNLFYMFASEASLQQFTANPERYAASVREAMGLQPGRSVR
jgi:YHS domain-containing protein